ncbi:MAG: HPr(Ser) kinase/phosphatase [Candidatus Omnitrophica bacterium]|nr:HPr(Ser) kinase/phosphatase [Candidatus Omnitrophota bacterium]
MIQVESVRQQENLHLSVLCGEEGLTREIKKADLNRPGLELAGCIEFFDPDRIQIFGGGEMHFLYEKGDDPSVEEILAKIFNSAVPCAIITNGLPATDDMIEKARTNHVPLLRTSLSTTRFYKRIYEFLEHYFSPSTLVHGTLVDILGMGVLLLGDSGVGKSECALELVSKGHSLVADDVVRVVCLGDRILNGSCPHLIRHYIEVRGLGIVDLSKLYGIRAIRKEKSIDLVITLQDWKPETYVERVGIDRQLYELLGVELPHLTIPVKPGRNISTIVEVGARDQRLKLLGINSAMEFNDRLMKMTAGSSSEMAGTIH